MNLLSLLFITDSRGNKFNNINYDNYLNPNIYKFSICQEVGFRFKSYFQLNLKTSRNFQSEIPTRTA
jgi:hypothetical protein